MIKIKFIVFDSVVFNGGKLFFKIEVEEFEYICCLFNCNKWMKLCDYLNGVKLRFKKLFFYCLSVCFMMSELMLFVVNGFLFILLELIVFIMLFFKENYFFGYNGMF